MSALTSAERAHFEEQGFLVREGLVPASECDAATRHLSHLIERIATEYRQGARTTFDFWKLMPQSLTRTEVFWDMADGGPGERPAHEWERFAMRIGHQLHLHDPVFARLAHWPAMASILDALTGSPAGVVQSAVIYKQPHNERIGFSPHQDAWFVPCQPADMALGFLALDDCTIENGCLEVIPGSHKAGLTARFSLGPGGYEPHDVIDSPIARAPTVKLPVPKGSVIFVHGLGYHASAPNDSDQPRRALITHVLGRNGRMDPRSWIQPPAGGFVPIVA